MLCINTRLYRADRAHRCYRTYRSDRACRNSGNYYYRYCHDR